MNIQPILNDLDLKIGRYEPVHGGDINLSFCLHANGHRYFLKVNDAAKYPAMFKKEARGLAALSSAFQKHDSIFIPAVLKHGTVNSQQYLLLEWIPPGSPTDDFWEVFGIAMAHLHKQPHDFYGWHEDNYIGSLNQKNTKSDSWHRFFCECRVLPLVKQLYDKGAFSKEDVNATDMFCKRAEHLFPGEPASLLHGDLWSGNVLVNENGEPVVIDPAIYYGHREADLAMTQLFGGFDPDFLEGYHAAFPLQPAYEERFAIFNLFPLLVHVNLFGGGYLAQIRQTLKRFV